MEEKAIKLTPKQKRFIEEYVKSGNATEAARKAGYSPNSARQTGSDNLANPYIKAEIDRRMDGLSKNNEIEASEIVKRLFKIASADPTKVVQITEKGKYEIVPTSQWGECEKAAVKRISVNKSGVPIVEFYDRDRIMTELADRLGLYEEYKGAGEGAKTFSVEFECGGEDYAD